MDGLKSLGGDHLVKIVDLVGRDYPGADLLGPFRRLAAGESLSLHRRRTLQLVTCQMLGPAPHRLITGRIENSGDRQQLLKALFVVPSYSLSAGTSIQTIIRPVPFSSAINPAYGASLPTLQPMIGYQCSRFTKIRAGWFSSMAEKRRRHQTNVLLTRPPGPSRGVARLPLAFSGPRESLGFAFP